MATQRGLRCGGGHRYRLPRVSEETSQTGAEACECCVKTQPENTARCLTQAAGHGARSHGKEKRSNPEDSWSKGTVKNLPDSREFTGCAGTEVILQSGIFLRLKTVLNVTAQPLGLPAEALCLPLYPAAVPLPLPDPLPHPCSVSLSCSFSPHS